MRRSHSCAGPAASPDPMARPRASPGPTGLGPISRPRWSSSAMGRPSAFSGRPFSLRAGPTTRSFRSRVRWSSLPRSPASASGSRTRTVARGRWRWPTGNSRLYGAWIRRRRRRPRSASPRPSSSAPPSPGRRSAGYAGRCQTRSR